MRNLQWMVGVAASVATLPACSGAAGTTDATGTTTQALATAPAACQLAGPIKHVIYLVFDNVHFRRDNPNVPSDLEQMPHLLNFLTSHGTLDDNHHTPLVAHTATDILTGLTGLYPDRHGVGISNTFSFFNADGTVDPALSFAYWTGSILDFVSPTPSDPSTLMVTTGGKNAPAPWVPYTRAGCDFGAAGTANLELENVSIDVPAVFGASSAEAAEVASNRDQATADFIGVSVHCGRGSALCAQGSVADLLPDEPHGYSGFRALHGQKYVAPAISSGPLTDLDGKVITDGLGHVGFAGFDGMQAPVSLGYVAAMQEAGVPITTAYISTAHEDAVTGNPHGPGEAANLAHLKTYDEAFAKFFARLEADGIDASNTLFVVTADENDYFAGSAPTPANCDGTHVPCNYAQLGQVSVNLTALLAQKGITAPFDVATSLALYVNGQPGPNADVTRAIERAAATLTVKSPYTGKTQSLEHYLADATEMKLLHMTTADPRRTPTVTIFPRAEDALSTGPTTCDPVAGCASLDNSEVWVHGNIAPEINHTWVAIAGPGIKKLGVTDSFWSDHTDIRPTMLAVLGLADDYTHQGRVMSELVTETIETPAVRGAEKALEALGQAFKQLNAPVGEFAIATLKITTRAAATGTPGDDSQYEETTELLARMGDARDEVAARIAKVLDGAWFHGREVDAEEVRGLIAESYAIIAWAHVVAGDDR